MKTAKQPDANPLYLLPTVPGIGKVLSLVRLYAIHRIDRVPSVQEFASYCRLVTCRKASGGKRLGTSGKKIGNAPLKWALSEAAPLFLRNNPAGQKLLARLEKKHDQGKALSILAHKLARAVSYMLKRKGAFDREIFLQTSGSRAGEPGALIGHLLWLLQRRRPVQGYVCGPSPEPGTHWRALYAQPAFCIGRYEGTTLFLGRREYQQRCSAIVTPVMIEPQSVCGAATEVATWTWKSSQDTRPTADGAGTRKRKKEKNRSQGEVVS